MSAAPRPTDTGILKLLITNPPLPNDRLTSRLLALSLQLVDKEGVPVPNSDNFAVALSQDTKCLEHLIVLVQREDRAGDAATSVLSSLARIPTSTSRLANFPSLLSTVVASKHTLHAVSVVTYLASNTSADVRPLLLETPGVLDLLIHADHDMIPGAVFALVVLAAVPNAPILMHAHPGLVDKMCETMDNSPQSSAFAGLVLHGFTGHAELYLPLTQNEKHMNSLLRILKNTPPNGDKKEIMAVAGVMRSFCNLAIDPACRKILSEHEHVVNHLLLHITDFDEKSGDILGRVALGRVCHVRDTETGQPYVVVNKANLIHFCSQKFNHQYDIVKAIIRVSPHELVQREDGDAPDFDTPLEWAKSKGYSEVVGLLENCTAAYRRGDTLQHIVGYSRAQAELATRCRATMLLCLRTGKERRGQREGGGGEGGGGLNPWVAKRHWLNRGRDTWSVILSYAF